MFISILLWAKNRKLNKKHKFLSSFKVFSKGVMTYILNKLIDIHLKNLNEILTKK